MPDPESTNWTDAPLVFIQAATCPACGAGRPLTVRSAQGGDGSVSRRSVCRRCSQRFVVVVEFPEPLPDFGRDDLDTL